MLQALCWGAAAVAWRHGRFVAWRSAWLSAAMGGCRVGPAAVGPLRTNLPPPLLLESSPKTSQQRHPFMCLRVMSRGGAPVSGRPETTKYIGLGSTSLCSSGIVLCWLFGLLGLGLLLHSASASSPGPSPTCEGVQRSYPWI